MVPFQTVGARVFFSWGKEFERVLHISPSSASNLLDGGCKLNTVLRFKENRPPKSIPTSGKTELGTVEHNLYERAYSPKSSNSQPEGEWSLSDAESHFDELVEKQEKKLVESSVDSHLVPLSNMAEFDNIRLDACVTAVEKRRVASNWVRKADSSVSGTRLLGPEVEVWNLTEPLAGRRPEKEEYSVFGKIDLVTLNEMNQVEIIDHKTGHMTGDDGHVKPTYEIQILVYAALWRMTAKQNGWDRDLSNAAIEDPKSGERHSIVISPEKCQDTLERVLRGLDSINEVIKEDSCAEPVSLKLANPSPENCIYCEFRPGCESFHQSLETWMRDVDIEFNDIIGEIFSDPISKGGSEFFQFKIVDKEGKIWLVDGVDSKRYPEVKSCDTGSTVAVFGGRCKETNIKGLHKLFVPHRQSHAFYIQA